MGVFGWDELRDNVVLVGTATKNAYSGHDDVFNPTEDWDWSLFVPLPAFVWVRNTIRMNKNGRETAENQAFSGPAAG